MHIIGILSVKNESDFIERSIRFNSRNIDEFYIADDNSSDETVEIIQFLKREGFKINLFSVASNTWSIEQNQSAVGERLLHVAHAKGFDYAFLLDADELILSHREQTEAELVKTGEAAAGLVPWRTFIPVSTDCEHHDYRLIDAFRAVNKEARQYWKAVVPCALVQDIQIRPGNHAVAKDDIDLPTFELDIPLAHFPVRSREQFIAKIIIGYHKRTMKSQLYQNEGYHQLLFYEELKSKNFRLSFDDLKSMALRYTEDTETITLNPAPVRALRPDVDLKYPVSRQGLTERLNGFVQELSQQYAQRNNGTELRSTVPGLLPISSAIANCRFKERAFQVSTYGEGDAIGYFLLSGKAWEPRVSEYLYRQIHGKPGTCFIDVGANIGYTTCIASLCGSEKIYAFECFPDSYEKLLKTISLNKLKNVETFDTGLSNAECEMIFQKVSGNIAASHIKGTHVGWSASDVSYAGKVSLKPFDTFDLDYSDAQNIILKLDIEGHELPALQGMSRLLADRRLSNIIIEYNPETSHIENMLKITTMLLGSGFGDIDLIFSVRSHGWADDEIQPAVKFEKVQAKTISQMLACGMIFELGFNRIATLDRADAKT